MSSPSAQGTHTTQPPGSSRAKVYGLYVAGSPTQLCRDPATSPTHGTRQYNRVRTNVTVSRYDPNMVATSGHHSQTVPGAQHVHRVSSPVTCQAPKCPTGGVVMCLNMLFLLFKALCRGQFADDASRPRFKAQWPSRDQPGPPKGARIRTDRARRF